jgi:hypothetical protein
MNLTTNSNISTLTVLRKSTNKQADNVESIQNQNDLVELTQEVLQIFNPGNSKPRKTTRVDSRPSKTNENPYSRTEEYSTENRKPIQRTPISRPGKSEPHPN